MENILKETKITKNDFIDIILDELINSETINEEEYKLAIIKTNFELIQKHCKYNIKEVLDKISSIDDLEIDEIEYYFQFDVAGFMNEIKNK